MTQNQMPMGGIEPPLSAREADALVFSDTVSLECRSRSTGNFLFFSFVSFVAFHVRARNRVYSSYFDSTVNVNIVSLIVCPIRTQESH
jgi:hypothetical protein